MERYAGLRCLRFVADALPCCGIGHAMWIVDPDILTVLALRTRELRNQLGVAMRRVCTDRAADSNIAPAGDDSDLRQHEGVVRAIAWRSTVGKTTLWRYLDSAQAGCRQPHVTPANARGGIFRNAVLRIGYIRAGEIGNDDRFGECLVIRRFDAKAHRESLASVVLVPPWEHALGCRKEANFVDGDALSKLDLHPGGRVRQRDRL